MTRESGGARTPKDERPKVRDDLSPVSIVDTAADTRVTPRVGRLVTLQLPADVDEPRTVALILDVLADMLGQNSNAGRIVADLAAQLDDAERLDALREQVEQARVTRERERTTDALRAAWPTVLEETRRHHGYYLSPSRFAKEWAKYLDPETGQPYPIPRRWPAHWEDRLDRLGQDGIPWWVVRDTIHDVLTGPPAYRSFDTVIRRARRHHKRQQERAELEALRSQATP